MANHLSATEYSNFEELLLVKQGFFFLLFFLMEKTEMVSPLPISLVASLVDEYTRILFSRLWCSWVDEYTAFMTSNPVSNISMNNVVQVLVFYEGFYMEES